MIERPYFCCWLPGVCLPADFCLSCWPSKWAKPVRLLTVFGMWPVRILPVTLSVIFPISRGCPHSLQANGGLRFPIFALLRSRYWWMFTDVSGQPVCQILVGRKFFSYYRQTLHENTKERRLRLHHGGSLISRNAGIFAGVIPRPVPSTSFRIH